MVYSSNVLDHYISLLFEEMNPMKNKRKTAGGGGEMIYFVWSQNKMMICKTKKLCRLDFHDLGRVDYMFTGKSLKVGKCYREEKNCT